MSQVLEVELVVFVVGDDGVGVGVCCGVVDVLFVDGFLGFVGEWCWFEDVYYWYHCVGDMFLCVWVWLVDVWVEY